jgi:hypothetical protein
MAKLDGTWIYQSFRSDSGTSDTPPQLAVQWAPRGKLNVATDETSGKVNGTLAFAPGVELTVTGSISPATGELLEGIELTAEGLSAVYNIQGYFIAGSSGAGSGSPVIVGTVIAVRNDLAKQRDGTSGPFVLFQPPE